MNLKLVTWNMAFWSHRTYLEEAWEYLLQKTDADIFLFQESYPSQGLKDGSNFLWSEIGDTRKWGTGIYSKKHPLQRVDVTTIHTGSLVVGEVTITDTMKLTVVSLYGVLEAVGRELYAITSLHRMLSDLTGILNGHIGGKRNIILGGDLNASLQCDLSYGGRAHEIFFQRLEDFKLMNCFTPFFDDFVQTHRHSRSKKPWQNDYFFISKTLSKNLKSCVVIDDENVRRLSDHNPVVIEIEL
ncbi:MAG: endonuclease/exonuclease/phosphatase family protein [Anaerolineae bacterium]|nr:endonuclease/exonuclease/phosphatase family protein [Anaerolineae bacterium]